MLNLPSFLPPTALSPPTTIIPSLRRVTPCSSGIKARKGISPKSGYDYESSYPSNFNTGYVLLVFCSVSLLLFEYLRDSVSSVTSPISTLLLDLKRAYSITVDSVQSVPQSD
nr:hypothetical protein CFP56_77719 [Quercus suber]